jgi:hypothetical protein
VELCVNICTRWQQKNDDVAHVSKNHLKTLPRQQKLPQKPPRGLNWTVLIVRRCPMPGFVVEG